MSKKEIEQRIEELRQINKDFELITEDSDEEEMLQEIEGAIDEAIFFYKEKLSKLETTYVDIDQGYEYAMAIGVNVAHMM